MVVMEYLSKAKNLHRFFKSTPLFPPPSVNVVRRDISKALDLLHGRDFVFGDLRSLNILYSSDSNRTFLVDFDGAGKHGEARYSPCLNTELGLGVRRWQIMEKSHDRANLERVVEWLSTLISLEEDLFFDN
jgi:serine/threonine protein kinase